MDFFLANLGVCTSSHKVSTSGSGRNDSMFFIIHLVNVINPIHKYNLLFLNVSSFLLPMPIDW